MKNIKLLTLLPLLTLGLCGCKNNENKKEEPKYNEEFIYNAPEYKPLDIAHEDSSIYVMSTDLLGVTYGVKAAAWDDYDIKLRVKYSDYSIKDFDLKTINIPLDMRHYLGEVGTQHIYFIEYKWIVTHEVKIIENPDWHGYKCDFFDKDQKYLTTETVGYYQEIKYNGPEVSEKSEDFDYEYDFKGWNHDTKYIHQDMQFVATYKKIEKRYVSNKPYNRDYIGISALVDKENNKGSGLVYLGRVRHVAGFYTETKELDNTDLTFEFKEDEFSKYWNEYNESIVKECVTYKEDSDYIFNVYGNPYEIINNPTFSLQFDKRYQYDGTKSLLDDMTDADLSYVDPYYGIFDQITYKMKSYPRTTVSKNEEPGFYRYSIIFSVDVYLSLSFNKLDKDLYELGAFNSFIMAPVKDSAKAFVQYSEDGNFESNFDSKLELTTKALYNAASMISW